MAKLPANWPPGVLPLALDLGQAAALVGLSKTTFLQRVDAGLYPEPKHDGRLVRWDRDKLIAAWRGEDVSPAKGADGFFDPIAQEDALRDFLGGGKAG